MSQSNNAPQVYTGYVGNSGYAGYVHRVRYSEVDPQSIVFNSRYLEFFDAAMTEFYRQHGYPPNGFVGSDYDPVVVKVELNYVSSARLDDVLQIPVRCSRMGNSSLDLSFEIRREPDQELIATATITYVNIDQEKRTSIPIPDHVRAALAVQES